MLRTLVLVLWAAAPACAQSDPGRLIAALSGDWNGDELPDAVLLVQGQSGDSDLQVYFGRYQGLEHAYTLPAAIFGGAWAGQTPSLVPLTATSFAIKTEQIGIGRLPWTAQLTIAYRNDRLTVAGYSYALYDRIDPEYTASCDVNMLTGEYSFYVTYPNDRPPRAVNARTTPQAFALQELTEGFAAPICSAMFD